MLFVTCIEYSMILITALKMVVGASDACYCVHWDHSGDRTSMSCGWHSCFVFGRSRVHVFANVTAFWVTFQVIMAANLGFLCVVWYRLTDVSEMLAAAVVRTISDDGGSKHFWNVGQCLRVYRAHPPREQLHFQWFYSAPVGRCHNVALN
jgi:hypothetical protein